MQSGLRMKQASEAVVSILVERRWTPADLDTLPYAVALPIRNAIELCRSEPPAGWTPGAYFLLGTLLAVWHEQ